MKKIFSICIDEKIFEKINNMAINQERSRSQIVERLLKKALQR